MVPFCFPFASTRTRLIWKASVYSSSLEKVRSSRLFPIFSTREYLNEAVFGSKPSLVSLLRSMPLL